MLAAIVGQTAGPNWLKGFKIRFFFLKKSSIACKLISKEIQDTSGTLLTENFFIKNVTLSELIL